LLHYWEFHYQSWRSYGSYHTYSKGRIGKFLVIKESVMASRNNKDNESIIEGVINQVSRLTKAGRETAAEWVENVSPDAADLIRPETKSHTKSASKRSIKVTGPTGKTATAKKVPVKKVGTPRKAVSRSAHKSATR
jgi:hypothetical protein